MTQSQANLVTEIKKGSTWMLHEWEALKQCLQPDLLTDGSGFLPKHRVSPQHSETCKAQAIHLQKIRAKYLKGRSHTYFSCFCVPIPFCKFSL